MSTRIIKENPTSVTENLPKSIRNLPFASIIIPAYNEERTIAECIESLLKQDYPCDKYEIIIVDNNSTDNTRSIAKKYPVQLVIEDKTRGPAAARNKGVCFAKGEAFCFFDADQVAEKSWLRKILRGWEEEEKFGAFGSKRITVSSQESILARYLQRHSHTRISTFSSNRPYLKLSTGNAVYRRDAFKKLGGFDVRIFGLEDYDLALRLQRDLGYLIKYNFDAIIYHKARPTPKAILKREYRSGFARYQFERKHKELRTSLSILLMQVVKRTLLGIAALCIGLFKPLKAKTRKEHLFLIIFDISMSWANFLGRIESFLKRKKGDFPSVW